MSWADDRAPDRTEDQAQDGTDRMRPLDRDRRKALQQQYREMKPTMGLFAIRPRTGNKIYVQACKDLKSAMNGARARLDGGFHIYRELQNEWNALGPDSFAFEVLEELEYDKDESKTDYSEDLQILQMIWEEKLQQQGLQLYGQR